MKTNDSAFYLALGGRGCSLKNDNGPKHTYEETKKAFVTKQWKMSDLDPTDPVFHLAKARWKAKAARPSKKEAQAAAV